MTQEEFDKSERLTDEQRQSMRQLQKESGIPWDKFLTQCRLPGESWPPYVSVLDFHGMFVGIEPDGCTHT